MWYAVCEVPWGGSAKCALGNPCESNSVSYMPLGHTFCQVLQNVKNRIHVITPLFTVIN